MKKAMLWIGLLAMLLFLAACQAQPPAETPKASYKNISPADLQTMLKAKDFVLVNVHIPFEGNLPQTDLSIPYDTITHNLALLPKDKNAKIVLYCRSGAMSTMAAGELVGLGYTQIMNLDGGMDAWEAAGQPVLR